MAEEWLPEGWKVEIRVRKTGKKDRYYIDPRSGYVFRSLKDIDRYLLTGKLGNRVTKAKQKDIHGSSEKLDVDDMTLKQILLGNKDLHKSNRLKKKSHNFLPQPGMVTRSQRFAVNASKRNSGQGLKEMPCKRKTAKIISKKEPFSTNDCDRREDSTAVTIPQTKITGGQDLKETAEKGKNTKSNLEKEFTPSFVNDPSREKGTAASVPAVEFFWVPNPKETARNWKIAKSSKEKESNRSLIRDTDQYEKGTAVSITKVQFAKVQDTKEKKKGKSAKSSKKDSNPFFIKDPDQSLEGSAIDIPNLSEIIDSVQKQKNGDAVFISASAIGPLLARQRSVIGASQEVLWKPKPMPIPSSKYIQNDQIKMVDMNTKVVEKPGTLWSDPCIDFAIKTLTDAIPLSTSSSMNDHLLPQLIPLWAPDVSGNHFRDDVRSGQISKSDD